MKKECFYWTLKILISFRVIVIIGLFGLFSFAAIAKNGIRAIYAIEAKVFL